MAPDRLKIAKMEFQHMLDLGHMRPSSSNYSSPLHMVPKKESNDWRPVGDFRALNAQTKKDKYPIPSIIDFTSDLHGAKIFSHIDLVKAFHQILIASEDIHKTAICAPFGLFESTRMQFEGHTNKKKPSRPSKNPQTPLEWTEEAENSFTAAKTALTDATLLKHPIPGATLSVWTDASNFAIGSSLMQLSNSNWEPIAFLSLKLSKTQQNWSTYDRELLEIYTSIKKFRHMLECREFIIYTDQKPLTNAFKQKPDKCTPRQLRHLDYISQFSTDIRYVVVTENKVADALSRVEIDAIIKPPILDYKKFAQTQLNDSEIQSFLKADSSIKLEKQYFPLEDVSLYCDKSLTIPRPFIPKNLRQVVFQNLHFLSHPGISATTNLISKRFFWPGMKKDIKNRVRACEKCQRAKVFKHTKAPLSSFALPDARFAHIHIDYIGPYPPSKGYKYCLTIIDRYTRWA
ncbi:transposon Tf2-6 polyprotein [Trichonephila clavipes]|nr:transposon Tf2-6 polyprotein [Trichonephila clavipes]